MRAKAKLLSFVMAAVLLMQIILPNTVANASVLNQSNNVQVDKSGLITPYGDIIGGGGSGGDFTYYNNGVTFYTHAYNCYTCTRSTGPTTTIYLPSSFISKISGMMDGAAAGYLGAALAAALNLAKAHPVIQAIVAACAGNWLNIQYKDNDNGVTLVYNGGSGLTPRRVVSGLNYYAH